MTISARNLVRVCLTGGLLVGLSDGSRADEPGIVRISKPRPAPSAIQPATFVENVSEAIDEIGDSVEAPGHYPDDPSSVQPLHARPAGQFRFLPGNKNDCDVYGDGCPPDRKLFKRFRRPKYPDGYVDGWYGDCPPGGKARRFFGKGPGPCPMCGGYHHGTGCPHDVFNYFGCKLGFLFPTGGGGAGSPYHGWYSRVYPQDVGYADPRDGRLWAAQGYGIPVSVPLAPTVSHTYNYSWGIPASRLTPISNIAPY
jgi:hypothetical protein